MVLTRGREQVDLVFAGPATGSSEGLINACRLRQYVSTTSPWRNVCVVTATGILALSRNAKIPRSADDWASPHSHLRSSHILHFWLSRLSLAARSGGRHLHLHTLLTGTCILYHHYYHPVLYDSITFQDASLNFASQLVERDAAKMSPQRIDGARGTAGR